MFLQRVALLAGAGLLVFACGEKFTAGDAPAGGSSGSSNGDGGVGAIAGAPAGGDGASDGGDEAGGSAPVAGKAGGGRGGLGSVGGSGGKPSTGGRGGSGGSGGVVVEAPPIPLEGLDLWFDAGVGVTEENGAVSGWKDRSANRRDALQTAGNYRPKLDKSALNGKPAIVFDGVDDYLKLPALPGDFSHGLSIFVMAQQDDDETNDGRCAAFFEASNGPEKDDVHLGIWQGAMQYEVASDELHPTEPGLLFGAPELLAIVHQATLGMQLRRNGNGLGESSFSLPDVIERTDVFIGRTEYGDCKALPGRVAEMLVYSRAVKDAEVVEIEGYLRTKFACCAE